MMAFFFTMPISRMTPISAMMLKSVWNAIKASRAPTPADGKVDRIVSGMDVALVEHPEHDVDRDQRRQNEEGLVVERILEGLRRALEGAADGGGHADPVHGGVDVATAVLSDTLGGRLNEMVLATSSPW